MSLQRMPKAAFVALFIVGYGGMIWLDQNGYLEPNGTGPVLAFGGFAFAVVISFLTYCLLRAARWSVQKFTLLNKRIDHRRPSRIRH